MDGTRFDDIARSLTANGTRRQAMKGAAALALGGVVGHLNGLEPALAARRVAYRCPESPTDTQTMNAGKAIAQTFRPRFSGRLTRVETRISHTVNTIGDYILQVVPVDSSGQPNLARVLAKKTIPSDQMLGGNQTLAAVFKGNKAPKISKRKTYALVVSRPDTPNSADFVVLVRPNDVCKKSAFFFSQTGTGPMTPGSSSTDLVFTAYGSEAT